MHYKQQGYPAEGLLHRTPLIALGATPIEWELVTSDEPGRLITPLSTVLSTSRFDSAVAKHL